jgi:predicted aldo/keto reductase-like oxidoreductase
MPVLTCGGMRYQYQWQDMPLDGIPADKQANLEATVRRALDLGINHIETARGYGSSERQLRQVLPGIPRERIIVQTKIQPLADPSNGSVKADASSGLGVPVPGVACREKSVFSHSVRRHHK